MIARPRDARPRHFATSLSHSVSPPPAPSPRRGSGVRAAQRDIQSHCWVPLHSPLLHRWTGLGVSASEFVAVRLTHASLRTAGTFSAVTEGIRLTAGLARGGGRIRSTCETSTSASPRSTARGGHDPACGGSETLRPGRCVRCSSGQLGIAATGQQIVPVISVAGDRTVGTVLANLDGSVEPSSEPRHGAVVLQVGTQLK
jgi:hypothetical protein